MRGIILAGGTGSRLWPSTVALSKQLIPIYDKPLIYYPLSTLMLAGLREVLIISTPADQGAFKQLLGDGSKIGMKISYEIQEKPEGLAQAFLIGEKFLDGQKAALILGDNIFHGNGLGRDLAKFSETKGARIFGYQVNDPQRYGVAEVGQMGEVMSIEEKPPQPKSNLAIPGLYFFDETVSKKASRVNKSPRGEFEITSLLELYREEGKLNLSILARGTAWMDCGTVNSLNDACNYVRVIEERQGFKIGSIEEVSWRNDWISDHELKSIARDFGNNEYARYLLRLTH
jgi:glucose-1-phosphate thymidylyltransferase